MNDKIKVYNPTQHDVGVFLIDTPLVGRNIRPGAFIFMSRADIESLIATTTLFQNGHLRVEEESNEVLTDYGIDAKDNPNIITDDEIKKKLSMSAKKITEWLNTIDAEHVLDHICEVGMSMDLPKTKLEALQAKMPNREFI